MHNYTIMVILKSKLTPVFIIVAAFLLSICFYNLLPQRIVSHWGLYGEPNGMSDKSIALFMMPIIGTFMYILFLFIPKLDPLKKNIKSFEGQFNIFINGILFFLFYIHTLMIVWNTGYQFNFILFLTPAFSLLTYSIGILLEKAKRNWFIGIRTPWTLSSDKVWDKTHKLGSKLYKYAAVFPLLGIVFQNYAFYLTIFSLVGVSLYLVVYSYLEFKKE
ncbi:MAG: hypothetical protein US39_C0002G0049 [Microgenomates group bacterium GW2011_GWC1_37_12b]|uniref:DUF1648 domain-containing protein n=1 Tax=Candidatus Woesebacteria bacterium GW2011_GWB1_38_8b TaxID=1618571 RepID=A0A0G0PBM4_9BACT|nr:MAG: hypothetical protein US39_C0002G0049 [Microgenomates group bacterium GW2011_GWC1_37_12b]KKQ86666.1 MAG: hypothetical protein UT10_C0019G0026 [Candidatus Woesebacteria bacterium GW2011_GWB1_38_8b]